MKSPSAQTDLKQAVLYTRVSSKRQVAEGHGLESQATRCRDYAERRGLEVIKTFEERAVTGGVFESPVIRKAPEVHSRTSRRWHCGRH